MQTYNNSLKTNIKQYEQQVESGTESNEFTKEIDAILQESDTRINGTYIFNIILTILAIVITLIAIMIAMKYIILPTQKANQKLNEIVKGIKDNEGDLTARIEIKSNDEIGQLASGINEFIAVLQKYMTKMKLAIAQIPVLQLLKILRVGQK